MTAAAAAARPAPRLGQQTLECRFDPARNNFDAIRLVAALVVVFSHCYSLTRAGWEPVSALLHYGYGGSLAVDVFFVISGFLVTRSFQSQGLSPYIAGRLLRILPGLALVTLIETFVIAPAFFEGALGDYFRMLALPHLANVFVFGEDPYVPGVFSHLPYPYVNGSLWTLPVESLFYLLLPILLLAAARGRRWVLLAAFAVSLVAESFAASWGLSEDHFGGFAFCTVRLFALAQYTCYFLAGVTAWLYRDRIVCDRGRALLCVLILFAARDSYAAPFALKLGLPFLVLYAGTSGGAGARLKRHLGDLSYGTYLFGYPVTNAIIATADMRLAAPVVFMYASCASLAYAWLSWRIVERPALALKRRSRVVAVLQPSHGEAVPDDRSSGQVWPFRLARTLRMHGGRYRRHLSLVSRMHGVWLAAPIVTVLLVLDRLPRFYQGDSISYLATGTSGWIPPDRSWAYGFASRWLVQATHSAAALVIVQSLALLGGIALLCRATAPMPHRHAALTVFAIAAALDPLNEVSARYWLSDTLASAAFLSFVALVSLGLEAATRAYWLVPAIAVCGIAAIFVRVAYVPVELATLAIAFAANCRAQLRFWQTTAGRRLAAFALIPVLGAGLLAGANARVALRPLQGRPTLNHMSSLYAMGVFLPGLRRADFQHAGIHMSQAEFDRFHFSEYEQRGPQMWNDGPQYIRSFMQTQLHVAETYEPAFQKVCSAVLRSAMVHHPQTLITTYFYSMLLYFNPVLWQDGLEHQTGAYRALPAWVASYLSSTTGRPISPDITAEGSVTRSLLEATIVIYPLILLGGLLLASYVLWQKRRFGFAQLIASAVLATLLTMPLYSHLITPRYALPAVTLTLLLGATVLIGDRQLGGTLASRA